MLTQILVGIVMFGLLGSFFAARLALKSYRKFKKLKKRCRNEFDELEAQLAKRYRIVEELVDRLEEQTEIESELLERVRTALDKTEEPFAEVSNEPGEPGAMRSFNRAESKLAREVDALRNAIEEGLHSDECTTAVELLSELDETEEHLSLADANFNYAVEQYNNRRHAFFHGLVASIYGLAELESIRIGGDDGSDDDTPIEF